MPLTFLYDEYIDRPVLTEQKKPIEYIVPSPTSGVGTNLSLSCSFSIISISILIFENHKFYQSVAVKKAQIPNVEKS